MEIEIIVPKRSWSSLEEGLWDLTEAISRRDEDVVAHGFLGGEFGYGARFENDVFEMRPFYWGDCDCGYDEREAAFNASDPGHATECYQTKLRAERKAAGLSHWNPETQEYINDTNDLSYDEKRAKENEIYKRLCAEFGLPYPNGCAVHCTCGCDKRWNAWSKENGHQPTCSLELPNFRHKASGFEVRWYKYIGRDMETEGSCNWIEAINECISSVMSSSEKH